MDAIICARCSNSFLVRDESRIMEWECPVCGYEEYIFPEDDEGYEDGYGEGGDTDRLREY